MVVTKKLHLNQKAFLAFLFFVLGTAIGTGFSSAYENLITPTSEVAKGPHVVKGSYDEELYLYQYVLSNNVRLNLKPLPLPYWSGSAPRIGFRASFGRGELEIPSKEQSALAYVTNLLFMYGGIKPDITSMADSEVTIEREFHGCLPKLEFSVDPDDFCFTGQTKTLQRLKYLLSKMHDYFITTPIYDEGVLKNEALDVMECNYNTMHLSPFGIAKDKVRQLLASGNWRFGYPPRDQAIATTIDQIRSFLEKPLKDSYLELSIAGDFDVEECLKIVLETIGTLPMRDDRRPYLKELRDVQFPKTPLEKTFFLDKGRGVKFGTITIYWPTCSRGNWYKTLQLKVLAEILDWRLDDANKNKCYPLIHSRAGNNPSSVYNNYGLFEIHARTKPEEIDYAEQILLQMICGIRDIRSGISNEEFEQAINGILEGIYRKEQEITYWRKAIDCSQEFPDRLKWEKSLKKAYKNLKAQDIQAIAEEFLNPEKAVTVKILPS